MGRYSSRISVAISKERSELQELVSQGLEEFRDYLPSRAEEIPLLEEKESSSED
jgi:hypothetical protein